jgi:hypothetical protein
MKAQKDCQISRPISVWRPSARGIATVLAGLALVIVTSCASQPPETASANPRMTEEQVLALAKPGLPLPPHESYHTRFKDGLWSVWVAPDAGFPQRNWTIVTIQDTDGKVLKDGSH